MQDLLSVTRRVQECAFARRPVGNVSSFQVLGVQRERRMWHNNRRACQRSQFHWACMFVLLLEAWPRCAVARNGQVEVRVTYVRKLKKRPCTMAKFKVNSCRTRVSGNQTNKQDASHLYLNLRRRITITMACVHQSPTMDVEGCHADTGLHLSTSKPKAIPR